MLFEGLEFCGWHLTRIMYLLDLFRCCKDNALFSGQNTELTNGSSSSYCYSFWKERKLSINLRRRRRMNESRPKEIWYVMREVRTVADSDMGRQDIVRVVIWIVKVLRGFLVQLHSADVSPLFVSFKENTASGRVGEWESVRGCVWDRECSRKWVSPCEISFSFRTFCFCFSFLLLFMVISLFNRFNWVRTNFFTPIYEY